MAPVGPGIEAQWSAVWRVSPAGTGHGEKNVPARCACRADAVESGVAGVIHPSCTHWATPEHRSMRSLVGTGRG